ncbi:MAG: hypothetical protein ACTSVZ_07025 [Promethearchaeota archaeon]
MGIEAVKTSNRDQKRYFWVGISIIVVSSLLLILKFNPPIIVREIETEAGYVTVNFSLFIWLALFIIGTGIFKQSLSTKTGLRENSISLRSKSDKQQKSLSFAFPHLIIVAILGVSSYIQYLEWGLDFSFDNGKGNWLFLGGPSLFYATGFFPLIYAIGFAIYTITSYKTISCTKTDDFYEIHERRSFFIDSTTEIPRNKISFIKISNNQIKTRLLWIIPLGLQIILLWEDAYAYLFNPMAFDRGFITGWYYLLQVLSNIIVLGIILYYPRYSIRIHSDQKIYILYFIPVESRTQFFNKWSQIFDIPKADESKERNLAKDNGLSLNVESRKNKYIKGITGVYFILLSIISYLFRIYASKLLRVLFFLIGIFLIVKAIKGELQNISVSTSNSTSTSTSTSASMLGDERNTNPNRIVYTQSFRRYQSVTFLPPNYEISVKEQSSRIPRVNFDIFNWICLLILPTMMILNLISFVSLVPSSSPLFFQMLIFHLIFSGISLGALWMNYFRKKKIFKISNKFN